MQKSVKITFSLFQLVFIQTNIFMIKVPPEILLEIFHFLDIRSLGKISQVCKPLQRGFQSCLEFPNFFQSFAIRMFWGSCLEDSDRTRSRFGRCSHVNTLNIQSNGCLVISIMDQVYHLYKPRLGKSNCESTAKCSVTMLLYYWNKTAKKTSKKFLNSLHQWRRGTWVLLHEKQKRKN